MGFAASPGTEVLPTCSMALKTPGRLRHSSAMAASAAAGQLGS